MFYELFLVQTTQGLLSEQIIQLKPVYMFYKHVLHGSYKQVFLTDIQSY